ATYNNTAEEDNDYINNEAERTVSNMPVRDSPGRAFENGTYAASPFEDDSEAVPSLMNTYNLKNKNRLSRTSVPDVAADIITASSPGAKTATAAIVSNEEKMERQRGGGSSSLLRAIMNETASLKAVLNTRPAKTNKKRTLKYRN
ncbi:MAG: hypothetical protein EBV30_07485, partial [Actinobacteria bacterium]|nr:hypothetical protein [Actinomycetota bacterium]